MNYQQIKLTKQGKELIQKTIKEGSSIEFSEIRLSSQAYGQDELEDLTDLDNIQQTATLSQAKRLADNNIQLSAVFSNEEVSNGFTVNTIGVYVTNPDQVEETILYGVTSTDEHPFYMAPHSVNPVNMTLNLTVGIGEAENFSVNINPSGAASQEDLDSVKDSVKQLAESEAEFGPRLTELVQNDEKLTAQLAQTEQGLTKRVDNLVIPISPENVNVEVTDAQNSMLKAQTFKTIGKRFDDVEVDIASISGDYVVSLENVVENSDFSNGSSNWDQKQTKTVEGDVLISDYSEANLTSLITYVFQNATYDGPLYQSVKVMTPSEKCSRIVLRSSVGRGPVIDEIINPEANTWYRLSGIYESPTRLTNLNFEFESDFDTRASHIKEPLAIQLNNHFKENEMPRLEEIEKLLKSRNYYFQGRRTFSTLNKKLLQNASEIEKLATRVEDVPTNSTQGKKIILPNKTENITLFNGTNDAKNWHFEPIGTSEGSIDNVTNVDKSRFPAEKNIPDSSVHPWLYNRSSIWDGLDGSIVKLTVDSGNEGVFHVPLQDEVKLGEDEDIMLLIFVDNINGPSASFELNYFDQYPSLGSLRKAKYNKVNEGGDLWKTMVLPYTIGGSAYPRFEGNAPHYTTVNGVGLRVTDVESLTNIYVGGVFKVKNPLDKGILVIDFDDGFRSNYDFFEYMKGKYGYNANIGIVGSWIESEEEKRLDKWQMIEMENNGWDMISHTWDHVPAPHRGLKDNFDSIKKNYDWLGEHGCHRGRRFFCHPTNRTTTDSIYATSLFHDLVRGARSLTGQYPDTINQFEFPSRDWGGSWTEEQWRGVLQTTQDLKVVRHVHAHGIVSENAWNPFPDDLVQFKRFIDIIGEYDIEVMSYSELWDDVINRAQ